MFGVMLQSAGFGGIIERLFATWQQAGFFTYLFPFLLLFALIFGILTRIKIFQENKGVNAIIALVVALMALQFSFVSNFFAQLFPRVGVGLAIILVVLIVAGLFIDPKSNGINFILLGIGVIVVIVVLIQSAGATGWSSGAWWGDNWETVVGLIAILVIIALVIGLSGPKTGKPPEYNPILWFGQDKK